MFVVIIFEEIDGPARFQGELHVTEVRGPFKDIDRANAYIRNHLHDSLAINAQSWKVTNL